MYNPVPHNSWKATSRCQWVNPTLSTSAQSGESCPPEICEVTTIGWAPPHSTQHTPPIVAGKTMHASHQWHSFVWTQGVYTPNLMVYLSSSLLTLQKTGCSAYILFLDKSIAYFLRLNPRLLDKPKFNLAHWVKFLTLDEASIRTSLV